MPLVRVEVRNEYSLGAKELYEATDKDDPKAVLDGVAVAGLVGILRQLGDLAELAAEVFHDLQEQVMFTAARSHKMLVRVQHIEAALPPLEKAVMSQASHLHFAYTAGSVWHPNTRTKRNHFIHSDLPRFIMNSYEECRDPPRLHMLDKFNTGGPGACLRRYSDPSFFKKALAGFDTFNSEKVLREKKASKIKKKGSRRRNSSISWNSGRVPFTSSNSFGQGSATESISTFHTRSKSEVLDRSLSFDMRTRSGYIECVFGVSSSMRHGDREHNKLPSSNLKMQHGEIDDSIHHDEKIIGADATHGSLHDKNAPHLTSVTWDEKIEITEPNNQLSQKIADDESESQFLATNSEIKCVSGASPPTQQANQEQEDFSTFSLKPQQNGVIGSINNDEQRTDAIDNLKQDLLQEQIVPTSPSVTWDEKVEITEPTSQQPHNVFEDEIQAQLLPTSAHIEYVFSSSPSMDYGDQEHQEFSGSSSKMRHRDAIGFSHLHEQKIDGTGYLTHGSLQELNFPSSSFVSRDDFSTSSLEIQHKGDDGLIHHDEKKKGDIDYLAYNVLKEQDSHQVSSSNWSERIEIVEPNSQKSNSTVDDKSEAQLLTQSLEFLKLEKEASIHGTVDMEDVAWNLPDLPSEDDQFDEDGSETDKYMDALNTLESESETDSECQTKQEVQYLSNKLRNEEIECVPQEMHEDGQNSEATNDDFVTTTPTSTKKLSNLVSSEDMVHAEPPLITSVFCRPDISEVNDLSGRTGNLDVSGVKAFDSVINVPSSSGSSIADSLEMHEDSRNSEATNTEFVSQSPSSSKKFSNLVSSEDLVHAESPLITSVCCSPDTSEVNHLSRSTRNLDVSGVIAFDSVINVPSSSGSSITDSQAPLDTELFSSFSTSQEPSAEISDTSSIKVWTNGGLLGLEPSKPPNPSVPTIASNDSVAGNEEDESNHSSGTLMAKSLSNGSAIKFDMLIKNPAQKMKNAKSDEEDVSPDIAYLNDFSGQIVERAMNVDQGIDHSDSSTTYYDQLNDDTAEKNLQPLSAATEAKLEKSEDSPESCSFSNIHQHGLIKTSLLKPLAELPSVHDLKNSHTEASQDNINNSFTNFRHGVANSFPQNGSFHNGEYEPASSMKIGLMKLNIPDFTEQKGKVEIGEKITTVGNPKEELENGSPLNSCASSPPLEHMRISFHPIDDFATSTLKLKFPGGHHFHESIKDVMFPSFHLLPEPAITIQDIESESDDDTFCRSTPYTSDEDLSQQPESSSEQWEPGESSEYEDNEIYDALRRISSDESISSAFELCGIGNHSIHFDNVFKDQDSVQWSEPMHHNHLFDLPTLDAVDHLKNQQERQWCSDSQDCPYSMSQLHNEPTPPPPPPLPPVQWWATKSNFDAVGNEQGVISDGATCSNDQAPQIVSQPSSDSSKPSLVVDTAYLAKSKLDPQSNGHEEANLAVNAKEMDDREDLLLQIRTKSFSLRRTVPPMPPDPSGPKTNTKVAAMLEKAQAIRQAYVGSDEGGGDESWSDG